MLKSFVIVVFGLFLGLHIQAHATLVDWTEKGNGGDILVCQDARQNMMYDAYETEARHGLKVVLPPVQTANSVDPGNYTGFEDLDEALRIAALILSRVESRDPELSQALLEENANFKSQVYFIPNTKLMPIDDGGIIFLPEGCEVQQLVVQRTPKFATDKLYTVALNYWKTLNIQQKAVAIVHEVIYRKALRDRYMESSELVRYFNALLLSDTVKDWGYAEYRDLYYRVFLFGN
ncbi:hypothetical protein [Bdellovibrio sp. HCB337]|uniref:hypothetical protein n=1 Tax=Bdellovibrio sp. HCB337 TaxID=3394358 RepID=UPI0039A43136